MILALFSTLILFLILNISLLINEGRIKSILAESNFYDTAAFYVKNEIVTNSDFKLNEGTNFEDLNAEITAENIKTTVDDALHNVFIALENPTSSNKVFLIRFYNNKADGSGSYVFEKYVNLENNSYFDILANKNTILFEIGIITLLLLISSILLASSKSAERFFLFGLYSLLSFVLLLALGILLKGFAPQLVDSAINQSRVFQEPKLVSMIKRLSMSLLDRQTIYYIEDAIFFCILTITSFSIRKMFIKEDLAEIGKKI